MTRALRSLGALFALVATVATVACVAHGLPSPHEALAPVHVALSGHASYMLALAGMGATAPTLMPFRYGTRRHYQPTFERTITGMETSDVNIPPFQLDKTGFVSGLLVTVRGQVDFVAAGATLYSEGLAALFRRILISANLGASSIVDASGPGVALASRGTLSSGPRGRISALTVGAARTFEFAMRIPIAANETDHFSLGAINLQDPQIQVTVSATLAALNSVLIPAGGGSLANASMTIRVVQEYWEVPDITKFELPVRALVRTLEDLTTPLNTGENVYLMPRMGTLLQYQAATSIAGIRATFDQVESLKLRLNKSVYLETLTPRDLALIAAYNTPVNFGVGPVGAGNVLSDVPQGLEPGVLTRDYFASSGIQGGGDLRDCMDTEEITTTEYIITIPVGAGLAGNNTDFIRHVRRIAQML